MRVSRILRIFAPGNHNYKYKKMYIEKIKSPADLKKLDLKALQMVADETRQAVLNRVSKHGGSVPLTSRAFCKPVARLTEVEVCPTSKLSYSGHSAGEE